MLVYLSGPMSTHGPPNYNYPAFHEAAAVLRSLGHDVLSPAETAGGITHLPRETFIQIDLGYVQAADAVVVLPGWSASSGATLEVLVGHELDKGVYVYDKVHGFGARVILHPSSFVIEFGLEYRAGEDND